VRELLEVGLPAAAVCETHPGALLRPEATDIVNHLLRTAVAVAIVDAQGRRESILGQTAVGRIADWSLTPACYKRKIA
jgi:hypothetical protein